MVALLEEGLSNGIIFLQKYILKLDINSILIFYYKFALKIMFMKKLASILLLLLINFSLAQKSVVASGGNAIGTGGTASFSVGQVSYKSPEGNIVSDGVQQPYEIQNLGKSDFKNIELTMKVYPNPTIDDLKLKITDQDLNDLSYILIDSAGKILSSEKISIEESSINMKEYSIGIYFLSVLSKNKKIKSFKILKK
jgi:hypothetical protein